MDNYAFIVVHQELRSSAPTDWPELFNQAEGGIGKTNWSRAPVHFHVTLPAYE